MITTDPNHPGLLKTETGMQAAYLVLSPEERAKGFVRPLRDAYTHVGRKPEFPLRDLTDAEKERYSGCGFVAVEEYPEEHPLSRKYWTADSVKGGCGVETIMATALAETYARDPKFYGGTYCCGCGKHFPVAEFVWDDGEVVGS